MYSTFAQFLIRSELVGQSSLGDYQTVHGSRLRLIRDPGCPVTRINRSRFCLIPSGQFGSFCFLAGSTDLTADRGASSCHLDRVAAAHQSGSVFSGWIVIRTTFASWLLSVFLSAVDRHYTYILPRPEASHWVQRFLGPSDWVLHVSSIRLGRVPFGGRFRLFEIDSRNAEASTCVFPINVEPRALGAG